MADKLRKVDKKFVLSDSGVNCYGFRLLTEGYQLAEFQKNAIGYYMHRREDGVSVKWEDLAVEGDTITGVPVINLRNERGEQMVDEVENGFLNAASVGHIVVLEYSLDAALMLEGQTGPTITKWFNKECSLVDIPGNSNALTKLFDSQDNELNLADLSTDAEGVLLKVLKSIPNMKEIKLSPEAALALKLSDTTDVAGINGAIVALAARATKAETELRDLKDAGVKGEVATMLKTALEDKKITVEIQKSLAADYATNPTGLKALLAAMPKYQAINDLLNKGGAASEKEATWEWADYEKNDPSGKKLKALRADNPDRYKEIFDAKFSKE